MRERYTLFTLPAVRRGLVASLLVGSVVIIINQGPAIMAGHLPSLWQVLLTYLVPFLVSTVSSYLANAEDRH
jgi:thiamine transporter ThiT